MKGQLNVSTPEEYLAKLEEPRRSELTQLDALIRKAAPALEPAIGKGMLGYGPYHYKYASGREGDTFRIVLASNANYISLYAMAADAQGYVAERFKPRLPKASIGKSCVRFKRLGDLDLGALTELIQLTAHTGFGISSDTTASKGQPKKSAAAKKRAPVKKAKASTAKPKVKAKAKPAARKAKPAARSKKR